MCEYRYDMLQSKEKAENGTAWRTNDDHEDIQKTRVADLERFIARVSEGGGGDKSRKTK